MYRKIRIALAAVVFFLFVGAFLGIGVRLEEVARWQLIPALLSLHLVALAAFIVLTLLLGRVYCSVCCPLGIFQDLVLWIRRGIGRKTFRPEAPWSKTRWTVFVLCAGAAVAGPLSLPALIEPYSMFGRMASALLHPAALAVKNGAAWLADLFGYSLIMKEAIFVKSVLSLAVAAGTFVGMAVLSAGWGRLFCNTLCPAGTLLSAFSHRPLLRLKIDEKICIGCGSCARECKAGCVDFKQRKIDDARCVRCMNCLSVCRKGAIKW